MASHRGTKEEFSRWFKQWQQEIQENLTDIEESADDDEELFEPELERGVKGSKRHRSIA